MLCDPFPSWEVPAIGAEFGSITAAVLPDGLTAAAQHGAEVPPRGLTLI